LGGYSRYYRYARIVSRSHDPLKALARYEDVYWAVRQILRAEPRNAPLRIIEMGCGLGYLTAALRAAGYEAHGIDLSGAAIEEATATFGPWYSVGSERSFSAQMPFQPDLIVALEIIEHVPDPAGLLAALKDALAPLGSLIVSTPNRSSWDPVAVWQTDLPPVHLTWLSEEGMIALGSRVGLDTEFANFENFNALTFRSRKRAEVTREPLLNSEFQVINPVNEKREALLSSRIAPMIALAMRKIQGRTSDKTRSGSMVVRMRTTERPVVASY
jgi:SAM-dependent methyltransferase